MSALLGVGACAISALFFGTMFVPIKNFPTGDGIFVQWVMSFAILVVGYIVFAFQGFPGFYPLAMLGGAFWTIGNATAIPIISRLGMALSILIWNTTNCLAGWAGGRFGLFGMTARPPSSDILNYGGLACVIIGGIIFSRVRSEPSTKSKKKITLDDAVDAEKMALNSPGSDETDDTTTVEVQPMKKQANGRTIGFILALCAGVFYGVTFVPVIYMQDNPDKFPGYPQDGLPYVFSHYSGVFLTSTAIFLVYAIVKRNRPVIEPSLVLPSFCSGLLWAVAQSSFFVANANLSQTVTFPIISMLPGCIASCWSIFYFKEIQGRRNLTIMAIAMSITILGATLVGLSKSFNI